MENTTKRLTRIANLAPRLMKYKEAANRVI